MNDLQQTKTCTKCSRMLPISAYHKHATGRFGVRPDCKECMHEKRLAYYQRTKERSQEYSRKFYAENSDHVKKYQKRYAKKNKAKIQQRGKLWRAKNRATLLEGKVTYYQQNKERLAAIGREYQKQHTEHSKVTQSRRRGKLFQTSGDFTAKQLLAKCDFHGWKCIYCHIELLPNTLQIDHLIPLSKGGTNWIANIAPACASCNSKKGTTTYKEFVSL